MEFWGNFLTGAVKAPMQLDSMAKGMGEGLSVSEDLKAMFKKCCGLDHPPEDTGRERGTDCRADASRPT